MKLRMETGNFNIVLDENDQCYLPKGLSKYEFLGAVVEYGSSTAKIIDIAMDREDVIDVTTSDASEFTYYPETGLFSTGGAG